jgi:predicted RNA binding protein with dsRBD fold (UPF0201 family)
LGGDDDDDFSVSETTVDDFVRANKAGTRLLRAGPKLDLSSKEIGDGQEERIAMELANNTTVTALVLNKNAIGHQGCMDIADALTKNRVLVSIEMNDNSIGSDGCSAIAVALRQNAVLLSVSLCGNGIGPAGTVALAETLRINASLQVLGLGRNDVGSEGVSAIAEALRRNTTLGRLDLSSNGISDEGAMTILRALTESNRTLKRLNLEDNAAILPALQERIGFVLASRRVLDSFRNCLCKPLEKGLMLLAIHGLQLALCCRPNHLRETAAGPIFLLVRAAALQDSKVINVAPSSCKRLKMQRQSSST